MLIAFSVAKTQAEIEHAIDTQGNLNWVNTLSGKAASCSKTCRNLRAISSCTVSLLPRI